MNGYPTWGAYGVSKAALDHLGRIWGAELEGTGVRVLTVDPGEMRTDMGRPVLVNSACKVLEGQCVRSGGGLFYRGYSEFAEALRRLLADAELRRRLGEAGRRYVAAEYDWDVVERRTEEFLRSLAP